MVKDTNTVAMYVGVFPSLTGNPKFTELFNYLNNASFVEKFPNLAWFDVPEHNIKVIAIKYALKSKDGVIDCGKMMKMADLQDQHTPELDSLVAKFSLQGVLENRIYNGKVLDGQQASRFTYL